MEGFVLFGLAEVCQNRRINFLAIVEVFRFPQSARLATKVGFAIVDIHREEFPHIAIHTNRIIVFLVAHPVLPCFDCAFLVLIFMTETHLETGTLFQSGEGEPAGTITPCSLIEVTYAILSGDKGSERSRLLVLNDNGNVF